MPQGHVHFVPLLETHPLPPPTVPGGVKTKGILDPHVAIDPSVKAKESSRTPIIFIIHLPVSRVHKVVKKCLGVAKGPRILHGIGQIWTHHSRL